MNETKPAIQSTGMVAPFVSMLITAIVGALVYYHIIPADMETLAITGITAIIGNIASIYGRKTATKQINGILK